MADNQINHLETTSNETEVNGETQMEKCTALITGITGQNPACDLRSALALTLKRKVLQELLLGCPAHSVNPAERERVLQEYKWKYTNEEIDWYDYTYMEAIKKFQAQLRAENPVVPHKVEFRMKLIEQLKQAGIRVACGAVESSKNASSTDKDADIEAITKLESPSSSSSTSSNWLSKMNPFGKQQET